METTNSNEIVFIDTFLMIHEIKLLNMEICKYLPKKFFEKKANRFHSRRNSHTFLYNVDNNYY